jgi:hypothetical protein
MELLAGVIFIPGEGYMEQCVIRHKNNTFFSGFYGQNVFIANKQMGVKGPK